MFWICLYRLITRITRASWCPFWCHISCNKTIILTFSEITLFPFTIYSSSIYLVREWYSNMLFTLSSTTVFSDAGTLLSMGSPTLYDKTILNENLFLAILRSRANFWVGQELSGPSHLSMGFQKVYDMKPIFGHFGPKTDFWAEQEVCEASQFFGLKTLS